MGKQNAVAAAVLLAALLACKKQRSEPTTTTTPTVATTTAAVDAAPVDTWTKFESEPGKFQVRVPYSVSSSTQSTTTEGVTMDTHLFTAQSGNTAYQIAYTDYPAIISKVKSKAQLLKDSEKGTLKALDTTAESSKAIEVEKHPAREFNAKANVKGIDLDYHCRLIAVKNRLYQMQVLSETGGVTAADREKFFASFELVD